ncbi:GntR family transcriptional regulator [Rheinheimera hassiensis]|uniref:GntR family transcriptional regulator n=1 Tax=Rheinheimera hassiensis TaxID=1193627 RepID=UPI001F056EB9|nr:GntR family transcriptional regulator [Rheinheimera hassiensis]
MLKKQQLYNQLKQHIQLQHWPPGTVLTQQQLAEHYGVSRIVVRDVQQALLSDGWLEPHGKAGIQVPGFSATEAQELCLLRLQLEPLALQLAAANMSFSQLGQAEDLLAYIAAHKHLAPYQRGELNWQFHRILYQSCAKPHLLRLLDQLHQQVSRYLGYQEQALAYADTSAAEHAELLSLLRHGDTEQAGKLLVRHITEAGNLLVQLLQKQQGAR